MCLVKESTLWCSKKNFNVRLTSMENRSSRPTTFLIRGALWSRSACVVLIFSELQRCCMSSPIPPHAPERDPGISKARYVSSFDSYATYNLNNKVTKGPFKLTKLALLINFMMKIKEIMKSFLIKLSVVLITFFPR